MNLKGLWKWIKAYLIALFGCLVFLLLPQAAHAGALDGSQALANGNVTYVWNDDHIDNYYGRPEDYAIGVTSLSGWWLGGSRGYGFNVKWDTDITVNVCSIGVWGHLGYSATKYPANLNVKVLRTNQLYSENYLQMNQNYHVCGWPYYNNLVLDELGVWTYSPDNCPKKKQVEPWSSVATSGPLAGSFSYDENTKILAQGTIDASSWRMATSSTDTRFLDSDLHFINLDKCVTFNQGDYIHIVFTDPDYKAQDKWWTATSTVPIRLAPSTATTSAGLINTTVYSIWGGGQEYWALYGGADTITPIAMKWIGSYTSDPLYGFVGATSTTFTDPDFGTLGNYIYQALKYLFLPTDDQMTTLQSYFAYISSRAPWGYAKLMDEQIYTWQSDVGAGTSTHFVLTFVAPPTVRNGLLSSPTATIDITQSYLNAPLAARDLGSSVAQKALWMAFIIYLIGRALTVLL